MITNAVESYGLPAVFVLILLEYACFPLSSEVVLPFSGAVAFRNGWSFAAILALSVFAGVLGAFLCYLAGRIGGPPLMEAVMRRFPRSRRGLEASRRRYERYAALSSCVGRLIPLCRTYISFFAGISRQNAGTYLLSTALGVTVWNGVLIGLGYLLAENWDLAGAYYEKYKLILLPVLAALLLALAVSGIRRRRKRKRSPPDGAEMHQRRERNRWSF